MTYRSKKIDSKHTKFKPQGFIVENPEEDEDRKKYDFFTRIPLKGAHTLRSYLKIDETSYRYIAGTAHGNARDYYLYGVLDEVERAGIAMQNYSEFILGSRKENNKKKENDNENLRLTRNIIYTFIDEMSVWIRKLNEILVELVGFKYSNENKYYKYYLLVRELKRIRRVQKDFKDFYDCDSENLKYQINRIISEVNKLAPQLNSQKCWYVNKNKSGVISTKISNHESRLQSLLPRFTNDQKITIGLSYMVYADTSQNIHVSLGEQDYEVDMKKIEAYFSEMGILSAHILILCKDILGRKPRGFLGQLNRITKQNKYPNELLRRLTRTRIKKLDFVVAYGDLGEVVKVKKSRYGYKTFRIKYIGTSPLPNIHEDEFPAKYVKLLQGRSAITRKVRNEIKNAKPKAKIDNRQIVNFVRKAVVHEWEDLGLKERIHGRPDLANKKIKEYLEKVRNKQD
ncbi:hypothetical protein HY468_04190 [Candidatus Roizmanbacteria bacterium]|nr:hypothetical protein [Candidatus Roizmanbacteria bacterium]